MFRVVHNNNYKFIYLLLFLVPFNLNAASKTISGKIIEVITGDTVVLQDDAGKKHTLRLEGIDAPEIDQKFGVVAQKKLSGLLSLSENQVEITYFHKDRNGYLIATVYPLDLVVKKRKAVSINKILVEDGFAWAYRKYSMNYVKDEEKARKEKLGIWAEARPIAPWEWRKRKK